MPTIFNAFGYKIYIWSNENGEPIHVHICRGAPSANATKVWLTKSGGTVVCHNKSRISEKDLSKLRMLIQANYMAIQSIWVTRFGYLTYYC